MSIDLIVMLRAIIYGIVGVFAYISRSVLATCAAIVLFFLPIVQEYGSRQLAMKFSLLTTLVAVMLIYRVVRYEGEIRRLVLIIADARPNKKEMPRYHAKQFGKLMGATLACAFLVMLGLVVRDLTTTTPGTRDKQPLPVATPSPTPVAPPVQPGLDSPAGVLFEHPIPPTAQQGTSAAVSGGQNGQPPPVVPAPNPVPFLQQALPNVLNTVTGTVTGILKP